MSSQIATLPDTLTTWAIDPDHSLVELAVRHMMITTVKGRFRDVQGTIVLDETEPGRSSVEVRMAAASIDTGVAQRDEHLRSPDFLEAEQHPFLEFRSRRVEGAFEHPGDGFRIVGDLSIRGVSREVVLESTFEGRGVDPWGNEKASFSARTSIDRRDFGLTWNQALETGGLLVANEVKIAIDLQANRV
jgi:polyisoprenoid-binding protein YceI